MCCAGVGTLSAHEMTTGRASHQQISPIKGQIVIYRPSIGPDSLRNALRATFVGNHRESSGESRLGGRYSCAQIDSTKRGDRYANCRITVGLAHNSFTCYRSQQLGDVIREISVGTSER